MSTNHEFQKQKQDKSKTSERCKTSRQQQQKINNSSKEVRKKRGFHHFYKMSEIEKLQWKVLTHDGKVQGHYRIKVTGNKDMYFQWTNGHELFEEILKSTEILERLRSLNGKSW